MNCFKMVKRKAKLTDGKLQSGKAHDAKRTSTVLEPNLEKENATLTINSVECVASKLQIDSDNQPVRRVLRSCTLKSLQQVNNCSDKQFEKSAEIRDKGRSGVQKETGWHKKKIQESPAVSLLPCISQDKNMTIINSSFETSVSKGTLFSSTPMTRPADQVKSNGHKPSNCHKNERPNSSISIMPSTIISGDQYSLKNPFKPPLPKLTQLKDVPFSSTPMKDSPETSHKIAAEVLPKLVLSPIRNAAGCQTRSKANNKPKLNSSEKAVPKSDLPPHRPSRNTKNKLIKEREELFQSKPVKKFKTMAKKKAPLQKVIQPDVDILNSFCEDNGESQFSNSLQNYTRTPEKSTGFMTSGSCSVDSGSGEYDPLKLFILHDPITMSDLPDPRTSKFRKCEMKNQDFDDLGLPIKLKKPANIIKKTTTKNGKVDCEDKVNQWLQEIQKMNEEFSEIESMELCIE